MCLIYNDQIKESWDEPQKKSFWKFMTLSILAIILIIFLWQYNFVPFQINTAINTSDALTIQKKCDQALVFMDTQLQQHSFLDSYLINKYIDFEKNMF